MNPGKEKCEILKTIRMKIAQANGIDYQPHPCTHEGPCPGTCPLCDQELQILTEQYFNSDLHVIDVISDEEWRQFFNCMEGREPDDDGGTLLLGDIGSPDVINPDLVKSFEEDMRKAMQTSK